VLGTSDAFTRLRPVLRWTFVAALGLLALSGWRKGALVGPRGIRPELLQEPLQLATDRKPFTFDYRGKQCRVQPVATYELWGLVVSHNDIHSVADIYHDTSSVDTKDLCVVWGESLRHTDYLRASYKSGPFTCYVSWRGVLPSLDMANVGNNHMITDSPAVREAIGRVHVGDQVHFKGLLVNYQMEDWESFWRRTSTSRTDSDCEVVYVEELEILARGTPGWYTLWRLATVLLVAAPLVYLWLFWRESGKDSVKLGEL
jgi:hypothetical protein